MSTLSEYRDREHWSYSSINQFLIICSLQWAFERLYKLPRAFTPVTLTFGSVFHRVMEWAGMVRKEGRIPAKKDATELFTDLWARQLQEDKDIRFDEDATPESCAQQGRDLVACAVDFLDPEERVVAVNEAFAVPLRDVHGTLEKPLVGEVDLIVEKDERLVVDYKTSGRRWPKDQAEKSLQPTVYLYAETELHGLDSGFRFDVLVKNKTPVFESHTTRRTLDQFDRMVTLVRRIESMVQAEHFLPNETSFYCAGCPFQAPCKAWHRAQARTVSVAA